MESSESSRQQNKEIRQVKALLSKLRLKPERGRLNSYPLTSPVAQPLNKSRGAATTLSMVSQDFGSPTSSISTRLVFLLSSLPKLSIPTPFQPLDAFVLFPKLPLDIRVKIWNLFALQRRQVKLFLLPPTQTRHKSRLVNGQSKIPAIMHVCKESRGEGLRYYTLCKEDVWPSNPFKPYRGPNYLYITFDIDHFAHDVPDVEFVGGIGLGSYTFGPEVLKKIKFVDLLMYGLSGPPPFFPLRKMLRESEELVEFRIIMNKSELRYCRFYDANEVGLEDFKLRCCARGMLLIFLSVTRLILTKMLIGEARASSDRGTLSGVLMDWHPPLVKKGAWDFSLEELDLQSRVEERITF